MLPRFTDPRALAAELVRRGWLTTFQVDEIFLGRADGLLLGSYVLLDKLGEGGMGTVFRARNWKLGQVVAVKLIRPERLAGADAVRRFRREIKVAAQLDHPNVVRALDADEVNGTHLFVMEYVEGQPLNKVVKRRGPLPVAEACDYVRQAALGLQHAFERGLVHRDVKPANLLLTPAGTVKVLDMGLARKAEADGDDTSTLTREGTVMGTPNYMAPEQGLDARSADIRADSYGLGCTLYYLLTGRVPFPGGSLAEKLMRHQLREPEPIEALRPDVPPAVAALVRRLMSKDPAGRPATPADLANTLASLPPVARRRVRDCRRVSPARPLGRRQFGVQARPGSPPPTHPGRGDRRRRRGRGRRGAGRAGAVPPAAVRSAAHRRPTAPETPTPRPAPRR